MYVCVFECIYICVLGSLLFHKQLFVTILCDASFFYRKDSEMQSDETGVLGLLNALFYIRHTYKVIEINKEFLSVSMYTFYQTEKILVVHLEKYKYDDHLYT